MATEKKPIRYLITKLNFIAKPGINQYFKVDYATYPYEYDKNIWTNVGNNLAVTPEGEFVDKLEFTDLADNTEYIIRFTDKSNKSLYVKFKTGINMGLLDSPYYNKVLFPGQVYDFYNLDLTYVGVPGRNEVPRHYYPCTSKAECNIDGVENWGSLVGLKEEGAYWANTLDAPAIEKVIDKQGYAMSGFFINNSDTSEEKLFIGYPNLQWNEGEKRWKAWKYYDSADGGGGIAANDCYSVAFAFLLKEDAVGEQMIAGYDTGKTKNASVVSGRNSKWILSITEDNRLKITTDTGTNVGSNILERNRWYFIYCENTSTHLYTMNPPQEDNNQGFITLNEPNIFCYPCPEENNNRGANAMVPMCFGGPNTKGLYIKSICSAVLDNQLDSVINKCLNPEKYGIKLKLSGTTGTDQSWEYLTSNKFNLKNASDKISFCIDPDLVSKIEALQGKDYLNSGNITITIMSDTESLTSKTFSGFTYIDNNTQQEVHVSGFVNPITYMQDSFKLNFREQENPVTALSEYFFTKHGTWGGYNGGVNGHNTYFNGAGNLVLECHGDNYKGTLKGVGKESKAEPYTGFGGDVKYDGNSWDIRSNKLTARTGTALVSNKYFGYGKIDITMKIPKNIWGVCPAIWLFHYIEIGDTDARYNQEPYNQRNAQGSAEDGYYRVVNNEIDIELPSHLTNGVLPNWSSLSSAYFDKDVIDNQLHIGVSSGSDRGLFQLIDPENPNVKNSWVKVQSTHNPRYKPSFQNIKFNNWIGELYAGNGWCLPQEGCTAEEWYKGTNEASKNNKEEYLSQLTHGTDYPLGFADGQFHKWSIIWLPDRTLLYVDGVLLRENRGFVPFNIMKLTIAGWFPTMKETTNGVIDSDGIHGTQGAVITNLDNTKDTSIGTWAGTQANFEVLHLELSEIEYTKYNVGDDIIINGKTTHIDSELLGLGESFPESGLRQFTE